MIGNRPASANDHVGLERYMLMARQYFTSFVSVCCFVTSVTAFPNLIEEMLRLETPIQGSFRLARRNTSVGGAPRCWWPPARQPRRHFEHPDQFELDPPNGRQHLGFAHGIHTCAGAAWPGPRPGTASTSRPTSSRA